MVDWLPGGFDNEFLKMQQLSLLLDKDIAVHLWDL
jgi:hypothetical protein